MFACLRADLQQLSSYHLAPLADDVCKLDANESAWDVPEAFKLELSKILTQDIQANRYPDGIYADLKGAIAEYVGCSPEWITVGNGSDELIRSLLLVACLGQGSIWVAEPTFSMYGILAQTLGINVVRAKRDQQWAIDLAFAQESMAQAKIAAVFVVNPNSPTGNLLTTAEIAWLSSLPRSVLVVIDEAYFEYAGISCFSGLTKNPNWVILRTFSKAFRLAAYRVGYAIAHPEIISTLEKVKLPYNLPTISARSAQLAIQYRHELLANLPAVIVVRDEFYYFLKNLGIRVWQSWGNFLYCQSDDAGLLSASLRSAGILVRQTGGGLRITIGTLEEMEQCKRVIQTCKK